MTDRFTYLWRVGPAHWLQDDHFERLTQSLLSCPETVDEIALVMAEASSNAYYPPEVFERDLDVCRKRIEWFHERGIRTGINVWPTFGIPGDPDCPDRPKLPDDFDRMVGMDGAVDPSVPCPISPGFLKHITYRYRRMAEIKPDFIWVDDDTRMTYITQVRYPCFCDRCLSGFQDGHWTREALVEALNQPENQALRVEWCDYGGERLALFCRELRRTVDEVDPSIDLPFMSTGQTHSTYSGNYLARCMEELRSSRGRPGHGCYRENRPEERFWKAMEAGRQVKQYPPFVESSLWEEESHPCFFLNKSGMSRLQETLLSLVMGGTGVAFNHLETDATDCLEITRAYERELHLFAKAKPVLQAYLSFAHDLPHPGGFWPVDSIHMMAAMDCKDGWFKEGGFSYSSNTPYSIDRPEPLAQQGIPLTPFDGEARAVLLSGYTLDCLSDDELRKVLSGNVILDGAALTRLWERGFGEWTGVKLGKRYALTRERLTDHPMNGPYAGSNRIDAGGADELMPMNDAELIPLNDRVESLAFMESYYDRKYGCCMSKYENELGGKIIVSSYSPWRGLGTPGKTYQLREIAKWMGSPCWIEYPEMGAISKLIPYVRTDGKRAAVTVFNAFMDEAPTFEVWIPGSMTHARLLDLDGNETAAETRREGDALVVTVSGLRPWREAIILAE